MKLGNAIRSGSTWVLADQVGSQIITFLFSIILARLLLPSDFGMLVTIQIYTGLAAFISGGGLGQALVQTKEVTEKHYRVAFTIQTIIGLLIYLLFFSISPWFAEYYQNPLYADLLKISALTFLMRPLINIPSSILHRNMNFRPLALISLAVIIFSSTISVSLALLDFGVWSLVWGGLGGSLLNIVLLSATTRWKPGIQFDAAIARLLSNYGFKVSANSLVEYGKLQTANFTITNYLGPAAVGLYNKAASLNAHPMKIAVSPYKAVFRSLASIRDNQDQSKYIYLRTITLVMIYTLPFFVLLWWLAEPFIVVVYGEKWQRSAEILEILVIAGIFRCVSNPSGAVIEARNHLTEELRVQIAAWLVLILGCIIGMDNGMTGIAWAVVGTSIFTSFLMSGIANRSLNSNYYEILIAIMPALILNTLMFTVMLATHFSLPEQFSSIHPAKYLLAMGCVGSLTYILLFLFSPIKALETESMRWKTKLNLVKTS